MDLVEIGINSHTSLLLYISITSWYHCYCNSFLSRSISIFIYIFLAACPGPNMDVPAFRRSHFCNSGLRASSPADSGSLPLQRIIMTLVLPKMDQNRKVSGMILNCPDLRQLSAPFTLFAKIRNNENEMYGIKVPHFLFWLNSALLVAAAWLCYDEL